MNSPNNTTQQTRRRGRRRRRTPEPCADCIQRAGSSGGRGEVRLCNDCARTIGAMRARPDTAPRYHPVNQRRGGIRRNELRRRATTNLMAARNPQSVSPVAARVGDFTFVPINVATAVLEEQQYVTSTEIMPWSSIQDPSIFTTLPDENTAPLRPSRSPAARKSDIRSSKEKLVELPYAFASLDDAYDVFHPVHDRLATLIMSIENSTDTVVTSFTQDNYRVRAAVWLATWESAFAKHLATTIDSMTLDQRKAAMTLKAHHLMAECFAIVLPAETTLDWSGSSTKFQAILDLADHVMDGVWVQQQQPHRNGRSNSLDSFQTTLPRITILDPVLEVKIRTTNVTLRERAEQLLSMIRPRHFSNTSSDQLLTDSLQMDLQGDQILSMSTTRS